MDILFLIGLSFELRASHLQNRCSVLSHTPNLFSSGYFRDGGSLKVFAQVALNHDPPDFNFPSS
jgi:hypothetical protein